jgi:nucleotide-binding universal stress UspA family protein
MAHTDIVVGVDGSASSIQALRWAAAHARATDAPLVITYAHEPTQQDVFANGGFLPDDWQLKARERTDLWVREILDPSELPAVWKIRVSSEAPGRALVEQSRHAALLVIGTREHVGLRRVVTGSVSHYCLSHAQCPVVAVPALAESTVPAARGSSEQSHEATYAGPLL